MSQKVSMKYGYFPAHRMISLERNISEIRSGSKLSLRLFVAKNRQRLMGTVLKRRRKISKTIA